MVLKFYNRDEELKEIRYLGNNKPSFLVIIGKRRVGKTELLLQFLKEKGLYFFVDNKKTELLLTKEFSEILKSKFPIPDYVNFENLEQFFKYLFELSLKEEIVIAIDEFQRFLKINPSLLFQFQKLWDLYHKKAKLFLLISGSSIGMMKKVFEEEGSPLFKRADNLLKLKPFDFKIINKILSDFGINSFEEKLKIYFIFGGIIYYYSLMEKYKAKSVEGLISSLLLREYAPLENEIPEILIEEFGKNHPTYYEILNAIALGKNTKKEMSDFVHIEETSLSPYLDELINLIDVVCYEISPLDNIKSTKKGKYLIRDNFFYFWFKFVFANRSLFERKEFEKIEELIKKEISSFYGKRFERFMLENFHHLFEFDRAGRWNGYFRDKVQRKDVEIDIVSINKENEIIFAECKWQDKINAKEITNALNEKSKYVPWKNNARKESFAIFAKSFSKKITEFEGKKVYCYDLLDLEKSLIGHNKV